MQGACLKGQYCEFSHDWNNSPNNICTFYQRGMCSYGSRCRYDHVKPSRNQTLVTTNQNPPPVRRVVSPSTSFSPPTESLTVKPSWSDSNQVLLDPDEQTGSKPVDPFDLPICSFAAAGSCPYGDTCTHLHGDTCPICEKVCLHPYRLDEREEHLKLCQLNNRILSNRHKEWSYSINTKNGVTAQMLSKLLLV